MVESVLWVGSAAITKQAFTALLFLLLFGCGANLMLLQAQLMVGTVFLVFSSTKG